MTDLYAIEYRRDEHDDWAMVVDQRDDDRVGEVLAPVVYVSLRNAERVCEDMQDEFPNAQYRVAGYRRA